MYEKQFDDLAKFLNLPLESVKNATGNGNSMKPEENIKEHYKNASPLGYINKSNIPFHVVKDNMVLLYCNIFKVKTCMELGCGASMTSFVLARNGINCVAYDYESDVLRFQAWRRRNYHISNLSYLGLNQLGRNKKTYEAFVCFEVLEHIQDPRPTIDMIDKHLAPKGILFLSISSQAQLPVDQREQEHICEMQNKEIYNYIIMKGYMVVQGIRLGTEGQGFTHANYPLVFQKVGENNET